jgi:hypothetical protein
MGRLCFTADEIAEIRRLLVDLRLADRDRQKVIRARIRRIGFYITDVSHDAGGFTAADFDALLRRRVITQEADSEAENRDLNRGSPGNPPNVTPERWTRTGLEREGFAPWVTFAELESVLRSIPVEAAGVYVVLRDGSSAPEWRVPSPVGDTWRGDPTLSIEALWANWVAGASVVYIGKAKERQLRNRLRAYLRFGEARGGRHWGGRLVWQLDAAWELQVAWRIEAEQDALDVERDLLAAFRLAHAGRPPFANNPDRLGR